MNIHNKNIVITGAANGIGYALAKRIVQESPKSISLIDISNSVNEVASSLSAESYVVDVSNEDDFQSVLNSIIDKNNSDWQKNWEVNVMSHIHAAKVLIPQMQKQGSGYIMLTVSAAGLLNMPGAIAYATTKHAAMGLAENLSIMYGYDGIKVSALCPQLVDTDMVRSFGKLPENHPLLKDGLLSADVVAEEAIQGINKEKFLILPHKEVAKYIQGKAFDYDAWIEAVRKLVP